MSIYVKNCFSCFRDFSEEVVPFAKVLIDESGWDGAMRETAICADCLSENKNTTLKWVKNIEFKEEK